MDAIDQMHPGLFDARGLGATYGAVSLPAGVEPVETESLARVWIGAALGAAAGATAGVLITEHASPVAQLFASALGAALGGAAVAGMVVASAQQRGAEQASSLDKGNP